MAMPDIDYMDLPNGKTITVCALHKQVVCGQCCLDLSFDVDSDGDNISDDEEIFGTYGNLPIPRDVTFSQVANSKYGRRTAGDEGVAPSGEEEDHGFFPGPIDFSRMAGAPDRTEPSGDVFPTVFQHPKKSSMRPQDLFPARDTRFHNRYNRFEMLIYTDGACLENGAADARGGCGFVFGPRLETAPGRVAFKLEDRGPDGQVYRHTSNRAELRAAVGALRFRRWYGESFKSIVIATDSTYVVDGATDWARGWCRKEWRLSNGQPVKNRDLWVSLLLEAEKLHDNGMTVHFWRIPREWNHEADSAAKDAAENDPPVDKFVHMIGVGTRFM
ncbi:RNase H domain-containing protein [Colletotrichum higginsianum]|uniref:ribonuclease H n=2 Tax=Colletotrichum higginsianum TaxID=80884 RepID=H1VGZ0_COLHI|nr:RNase H domain-containing protein [Colletotrichum higginsianum IMI 349063]OBR13699.1 RNase H domain-containing protein [Colletotrichum higginsianum IMI 349063]TID01861.1 Ribonuclease H [Colletotrichum higginsianum]CCF39493.1 RNase H domain-containing protein [Colletotrichum higginsianum]